MNKLSAIGCCLACGLGIATVFTSVVVVAITAFKIGNPLDALFWTTYAASYNYTSTRIVFGLLVSISSTSVYFYCIINKKSIADATFLKFFGSTFFWIVGLMVASYAAGYGYALFNK